MNANAKEIEATESEIAGYIVRAEGWKPDTFFKTLEAAMKDYEETVIESADFEEEELTRGGWTTEQYRKMQRDYCGIYAVDKKGDVIKGVCGCKFDAGAVDEVYIKEDYGDYGLFAGNPK
mgnify:CR=1 FL=1